MSHAPLREQAAISGCLHSSRGGACCLPARCSHEPARLRGPRGPPPSAPPAARALYRADDGHYLFKYLPAFAVWRYRLASCRFQSRRGAGSLISVVLLVALIALSIRLLPEQRRPTRGARCHGAIVVMGKFYARRARPGPGESCLRASRRQQRSLAMKARREMLAARCSC